MTNIPCKNTISPLKTTSSDFFFCQMQRCKFSVLVDGESHYSTFATPHRFFFQSMVIKGSGLNALIVKIRKKKRGNHVGLSARLPSIENRTTLVLLGASDFWNFRYQTISDHSIVPIVRNQKFFFFFNLKIINSSISLALRHLAPPISLLLLLFSYGIFMDDKDCHIFLLLFSIIPVVVPLVWTVVLVSWICSINFQVISIHLKL